MRDLPGAPARAVAKQQTHQVESLVPARGCRCKSGQLDQPLSPGVSPLTPQRQEADGDLDERDPAITPPIRPLTMPSSHNWQCSRLLSGRGWGFESSRRHQWPVAQREERGAYNAQGAGSTPARPTDTRPGVAQLAEQLTLNQQVGGSSPSAGTTKES